MKSIKKLSKVSAPVQYLGRCPALLTEWCAAYRVSVGRVRVDRSENCIFGEEQKKNLNLMKSSVHRENVYISEGLNLKLFLSPKEASRFIMWRCGNVLSLQGGCGEQRAQGLWIIQVEIKSQQDIPPDPPLKKIMKPMLDVFFFYGLLEWAVSSQTAAYTLTSSVGSEYCITLSLLLNENHPM